MAGTDRGLGVSQRCVMPLVGWCLCFAVIMGMPYFESTTIDGDPVSYVSPYGFVALGLVAGLWVASLPAVSSWLARHAVPRRLAWCALVALCCALVAASVMGWVDIGRIVNSPRARGLPDLAIPVSPAPYPYLGRAQALFSWLCSHANALALAAAFACAIVGLAELHRLALHNGDPGTPGADGEGRRNARDGGRAVAVALALVAGLTRAFAWTLCSYHPAFPLSLKGYVLWVDWAPWQNVLLFVPTALMALVALAAILFARRSGASGSQAARALVACLAPFAVGELAMRLLTRICPAILGISLPVAVVSLCVHVGCVLALLALGVCGLRRCECAHVAGCASMPGSDVCDAAEGAVDERAADRRAAMSDRCLELLATMGLTVNEAHAVDARVRGITSRQAADELGIRPSTVRAYGRRACVKLGVASLDDAATLVRERLGGTAPHQACESCGHGSGEDASPEPPGDGEFSGILDCDGGTPSRRGTAAMCLGTLGMTGATSSALLALLPYGAVANACGLIWETAFGAGAGLLAWLGLVMARHRLCTAQGGGVAAEGRMAAVRVPGAREAVRACLPVVLELALLAAGAFATLWCQGHPNFELARLSGAFADLLQSVVPAQANLGQPLTVAATAAFSLACLLCLDRASGLAGVGLAGGRGGVRPPVMWALTAGVLMAGASVLAVSLAFPTRRAVMSVALGLTVIGLIGGRVLCGGRASAGRAGAGESCGVLSGCLCRPVSGAPGLAGLGVALAVAFAWEETWRGAAYASLDSACVAFLAVLVAVGIGWTLSRASWAWGACLAWAVVAAAMCWSRGLASGLVGACAITALPVLCVMSVPGSRRGVAQDGPCKDGPLAWHAPALVAAAGCFASVYAANLYGTRLLMLRPVSVFGQSPLAVRAGFSAFVLAVCAVILLIVVLVWAAYIVLGERDRRFRGIDPEPTLEQRLRGYLVSRGLTAFEADVVLRLAHGRKVAEVSAELSYARSTVAAARQGAYRKLGVHSREQLVALLEGPCAS